MPSSPAFDPRASFGRRASVLALLVVLSGCATYRRIASYPTPAQPATVAVTGTPMSGANDLPLGAFHDEQRRIVVSGHQKATGVGMAFGLVGVLVANAVDKSSAADKFGEAINRANADLVALTKQIVRDELAARHAPRWTAADAGSLQLSPYALFTVLESGKARLYAMLSAKLPSSDPEEEPKWSVRYFVRAPGEYTIEGNDGWMTQNRYAEGIRVALLRAVQVCIDDTHGKLTGKRKAKAKGVFPYISNSPAELRVIIVQEGKDAVVARLAVGDAMVLAGTHVLDRSDYVLTDEEFDDPRGEPPAAPPPAASAPASPQAALAGGGDSVASL